MGRWNEGGVSIWRRGGEKEKEGKVREKYARRRKRNDTTPSPSISPSRLSALSHRTRSLWVYIQLNASNETSIKSPAETNASNARRQTTDHAHVTTQRKDAKPDTERSATTQPQTRRNHASKTTRNGTRNPGRNPTQPTQRKIPTIHERKTGTNSRMGKGEGRHERKGNSHKPPSGYTSPPPCTRTPHRILLPPQTYPARRLSRLWISRGLLRLWVWAQWWT